MNKKLNALLNIKRTKPYTFGGLGIVADVSVEPGVFSSLVEFLGFVHSGGLKGFAVFEESVSFIKFKGFDVFLSSDDFAGVSQFFCTTAY